MIDILVKAEFKTRKEAAWAVTNALSGGSPDQVKYLVDMGCIPPLCDLLAVGDVKIIQVALTGLENVLKTGENFAKVSETGYNPYAVMIEECNGKYNS